MNMMDVSDQELQLIKKSNVHLKGNEKISDDEIIKKSIETLQSGKISEPRTIMQEVSKEFPINNANIDTNVSVVDNTNYWPIKDLPSKYRLYKEETVIYGRPLKVLEIKKLSSINAENYDFVINDILKRATKGIPFEDIFLADKLYIILWLRANSYRDSSYRVDYTCSKCGNKSSFHFDVDNLEVQYLSPEYDPNKDIRLSTGDTIKIKFLTVKDGMAIERFKEINKDIIGEIDDELLSISFMIKEINGNNATSMEKYHFVLNLTPQDFSYLSTYIDKNGMGIKPYMNVKCEKCGGNAQIGVTFQPDFFFPEYKSK